jgi:uncharacterized membrane protein
MTIKGGLFMGRRGLRIAVCVAVLHATSHAAAQDRALTFTTVDFPGAVLTNVQGINDSGDLVGFYNDAAGRTHGFIRSGGMFRSVDMPGATSTQARGIAPNGDLVGSYQRPNESGGVPSHGFLLTASGSFREVDYPGHLNTIAQRILADGTILGCYHDENTMNTMFGMIRRPHGFDAISESMSMHNGATPDARLIVGLFTDMDNRGKAYTFESGRFIAFEVPGATFTAAWDVNASRMIVGVYQDAARMFHGFLFDGRTFARVDAPGATATRVFGINNHGDMVGAFVDAGGRTHGFVAQWTPAR